MWISKSTWKYLWVYRLKNSNFIGRYSISLFRNMNGFVFCINQIHWALWNIQGLSLENLTPAARGIRLKLRNQRWSVFYSLHSCNPSQWIEIANLKIIHDIRGNVWFCVERVSVENMVLIYFLVNSYLAYSIFWSSLTKNPADVGVLI